MLLMIMCGGGGGCSMQEVVSNEKIDLGSMYLRRGCLVLVLPYSGDKHHHVRDLFPLNIADIQGIKQQQQAAAVVSHYLEILHTTK